MTDKAPVPESAAKACVKEWHDRLGAMIDQVGHPDYSMREMIAGLRVMREEMFAAIPATPAPKEKDGKWSLGKALQERHNGAKPVSPALTGNDEIDQLLRALMDYEQADADGVFCKVSRQAVHEAYELIQARYAVSATQRSAIIEECATIADLIAFSSEHSSIDHAFEIAKRIRRLDGPAKRDGQDGKA